MEYEWGKNGTPPSFHEQRSLSERLYREQGVNTQILLGHTSKTMTDRYNDSRGKEWKKLVI
ncbi:integrase [Raoultella terrigena]|nr:integrase [Raoultella terrigena]